MSKTPQGWHTITPRIFAKDTARLVAFLQEVFQAQGDYHEERPTELRIGDSMLMVSNFERRGEFAACLYVYVPNVDETFARAQSHGVEIVEEPLQTPYGDRRAVIKDEWGNMWQIAQVNSD